MIWRCRGLRPATRFAAMVPVRPIHTNASRNQIGAVVRVQPSGGRGVSGIGPKAGGGVQYG